MLYGLYSRDENKVDDWRAFSWPNYVDIRDGNDVFASLLAHNLTMAGVREGDTTRRVMAGLVSANYFEALGVRIREGRAFLAAEAEAGADVPVAIVSHGYARRRGLGLGQSVTVNGRAMTIVGITPQGFTGTTALFSPEVWLPLGLYETTMMDVERRGSGRLRDRDHHKLMLVGRLRAGVTPQAAEERLAALSKGLEQAYPAENKDQALKIKPLPRMSVNTSPSDDGHLRAPSVLLLAMAGVVLLIACLNLANMLLARGETRRKEIAIRLAIGGRPGARAPAAPHRIAPPVPAGRRGRPGARVLGHRRPHVHHGTPPSHRDPARLPARRPRPGRHPGLLRAEHGVLRPRSRAARSPVAIPSRT